MGLDRSGVFVYDIETFVNVFTYTAIDRDDDDKIIQFTIWKEKNDLIPFLEHLDSIAGQIGYNNMGFDYPVIHSIMKDRKKLKLGDGEAVARHIYELAQYYIFQEFSAIKEKEIIIPQLDLFKIWHFDNKARITSLKKLEIAMNFENVQDMPYHHTTEIISQNQVDEILAYNINDVRATKLFYTKSINKINLRKGIITKYGLNCINYPDSKIGEQLMLKLYCEATGEDENIIKKKRTKRYSFKFNECIPDYITYKTEEFNNLLKYIKSIEVMELKDSFKYSFQYKDFIFDLGTGGIHGCVKSGIYESDDKFIIVDADVASLYPSLAITLGLYPEHLGDKFANVYEKGIVKPRLKAKEEGDKVMADGFKLSANSVYGKSNSEYSFLCDPLYTLKTTLAGQLALCQLSEMLMSQIPYLQMLQINTDGLTVKIPIEYGKLYWEICQEWEKITKLELEYVAYSKMIIRDVNNYIAVASKTGKIKYKGTFKDNYEMRKDDEWHKSFSQGIVATSVNKYFLENVPVEKTIKECRDIFEFCKTGNTIGKWWAETFDKNAKGEEINIVKQQKNNRYFLSKDGVYFRKCSIKEKDGVEYTAQTEYESNRRIKILNKYVEQSFDEYNVDYDYYIEECYKIIHTIDGTTERLELERRLERERLKKEREEENFIKFCIDKAPTEKQFETYKRDWLIERYGIPREIKPSKIKKI